MKLFHARRRDEKLPLLVFREFEAGVNLIEDYDQIARNFLGKIREVCPAPKLLLLVHDSISGRFQPAASVDVGEAEARAAVIPRDSRLAKWLKLNETHLELKRSPGLDGYLRPKEAGLLASLGIETAFPLISMNRLIGILLVGGKPGGAPLSRTEMAFIRALLPQAGIALENALLFKEQRERFRRMSRADRLATVGELAAGAAHEIRNPLTAIRSTLQYLESKVAEEASRRLIASALQETGRINDIVSALLAFSRPAEIVRERHDLRQTLAESLELVAFQARSKGVTAHSEPTAEPLPVLGDRSQLKQLFLNVFLNAIQAMPAGGDLRIEASAGPPGKALVAVSDTGEGIPEENLDRVFDPFFTTKKGGTGLGLSICYNIVKSHGGDIEARRRPGSGTTILIHLPLDGSEAP